MAAISIPVNRPPGKALVVGHASGRAPTLSAMQVMGFTCTELEDPYAATAELFKRPSTYRALVLSLASLFREELGVIAALKHRMPHLDIWLTHMEGRQAALAEAMRLGADGLLGDDGALHRTAMTGPPEPVTPITEPAAPQRASPAPAPPEQDDIDDLRDGEPVLSADELRALLQEQPSYPPEGD
jgi:hypothetical protein